MRQVPARPAPEVDGDRARRHPGRELLGVVDELRGAPVAPLLGALLVDLHRVVAPSPYHDAVHGEVRIVDDVASAFADVVVEARAPASIALSGGGTAKDAYAALATRALDWSGHRRVVRRRALRPRDDPDSNEGMARAVLLDQVRPRRSTRWRAPGHRRRRRPLAYDAIGRAAPPIDVVHLGLGPDGHTASLFPVGRARVRDRLVVANGDDLHPHPRLTFTYPALERAGSSCSPSPATTSATRSRASAPATTCRPLTCAAERVRLARRPRGCGLNDEELSMEVWELIARESIRDCIARYNANGDSGRIDQMVEVFAPDGIMETGRRATRAATRSTRSCRRWPTAGRPTRRTVPRNRGP